MEGLGERTNTRYCWFEVPSLGQRLIAEISIERYNKLKEKLTPATVIVSILPFCRPKISYVAWQDEGTFEVADKTPNGAFAGILYFMAGLGFLAWSLGMGQTMVALVTSYMSLALLFLSGYLLIKAQTSGMSRATIRKSEVNLLGFIRIGKGKGSFVLLAILCLALSVYLFANLSLIAIVIGLNTSMAAGSFAYLAVRA